MWMLDENKRLLLWNEMENGMMYLRSNLTEGFTNYFIHPDRLCYIMEDNFKMVPVDEFKRQAEEMGDMIWENLLARKYFMTKKFGEEDHA
ncbi:10834_t:CDS:2, partial [Funneliformis mosseae]